MSDDTVRVCVRRAAFAADSQHRHDDADLAARSARLHQLPVAEGRRLASLLDLLDRGADPDAIDPVTARIREFALGLPDDTADQLAVFLDRVREVVDAECA